MSSKLRRIERISKGLCVRCPTKAEPGRPTCSECARKARESARKRMGCKSHEETGRGRPTEY